MTILKDKGKYEQRRTDIFSVLKIASDLYQYIVKGVLINVQKNYVCSIDNQYDLFLFFHRIGW